MNQYRPGYLAGSRLSNRIRSLAPGTKPGPRWCPSGLTPTQKRRVQRLRAVEIRAQIAEKKIEEWFNGGRPIVPTKTSKEKRIAAEETKILDESTVDENPENKNDAAADMDANMVFALPAEFRACETEVAELVLVSKYATF